MKTVGVYQGMANHLENTQHYFMQERPKTPMSVFPFKRKILIANQLIQRNKMQKDYAIPFSREYRINIW